MTQRIGGIDRYVPNKQMVDRTPSKMLQMSHRMKVLLSIFRCQQDWMDKVCCREALWEGQC